MLEEKTINKKDIYNGSVVKLSVEEVLLPNGEVSTREIVETRNSVGILALTKEKKVIMVKQFRKAIEKEIYEIPAGCLDEGEDALTAAKRELLEETGYGNGSFTLVNNFYSSPGTNRAVHSIFFAKDVEKINENLELDRDEFLVVVELEIEELDKLFEQKKLSDLKTAFAYLFLKSNV
ncbi:MAG: NUDIX hydrolase [Bacilli bacterium]